MDTHQTETASSERNTRITRFIVGIVSLICLIVAGYLVLRTVLSPNEKKHIHALFETRASALNQKHLSQYLSCFSQDYRSGEKTYADLQADASQWFSQFTTIQFSSTLLDLEIQQDKALATNTYSFTLTNAEGKAIEIAQKELLELRREDEGWKIVRSLSP
ncbi:hypothetical protein CSA56_11780 [candidate division KSB3 bacterium]|uniref:DUF4440 domain-containing protein n=1 Tax=candidate division KSB3 bacterium TaxID=2044937 RepID=A0A2G6KCQ0_9BACT|nr:MAG: hypothetical protein CSA56_11780 [candidate division KSB3 bacterium]